MCTWGKTINTVEICKEVMKLCVYLFLHKLQTLACIIYILLTSLATNPAIISKTKEHLKGHYFVKLHTTFRGTLVNDQHIHCVMFFYVVLKPVSDASISKCRICAAIIGFVRDYTPAIPATSPEIEHNHSVLLLKAFPLETLQGYHTV